MARSRSGARTWSDRGPAVDLQPHVGEAVEQVEHVLGPGVTNGQLTAGHRDGGEVGGGLDAVGHGAVVGGPQRPRLDAAHHHP